MMRIFAAVSGTMLAAATDPLTLAPLTVPPLVTIAPIAPLTVPPLLTASPSALTPVVAEPTTQPPVAVLAESTTPESSAIATTELAEGEKTGDQDLVKDVSKVGKRAAGSDVVTDATKETRGAEEAEESKEPVEDGGRLTREQLEEKSQHEFLHGTFLYPAVKIIASFKTFIIPVIALAVGGAMMVLGPNDAVCMVGKLILYFGAQSFMNIFMSWVLHLRITIPEGTEIQKRIMVTGQETTYETVTLDSNLTGCPAGFALTAMQQVISFILFVIFFIGMGIIGKPYQPKPLTSVFEWVSVVIFGCVFAANIALNNFSLAYISIGVNLIIRSCLPLTTYLSQQVLANFGLYKRKQCSPLHALEVVLMAFGVTCAAIFVYASFEGKLLASDADKPGAGNSRLIGVVGCIASLLCGSVNLALAGVLGETKLNVLDTVAYMAIPATVFLMPIIFFIQKPIPAPWAPLAGTLDGNVARMTDWQVLATTFSYSKSTIAWLVLSGLFSFMYNLVQFNIVHTLSPSATAFGGNFNKAALTFMTLLLPFLHNKTPKWPYILIEWIALIINIMAFSGYSALTIIGKQQEAKKHEVLSESSEEGEVENGSGSE